LSRIHEENTTALIFAFLPHHAIPAFTTLLSILPARLPADFQFLAPYIQSLTAPSRAVLVHRCIHHPDFLSNLSEYTLQSCRIQYQYPGLISFWGGLITEALSGILDSNKSGRSVVQREREQALLHRVGPIFAESLVMRKVPSIQIASYMAIAVFVSKAGLEDTAVTALMEQTVHGWTSDTIRPALVCLTILAQFRSAKQMSSKVTKALMKVPDIGALLVDIGQERRIDKIANGLCLALIERFTKKSDARGLPTIMSILMSRILKDKQLAVIFKSLLLAALKLDDTTDETGSLRRELGSALIKLSQATGPSGDIIQTVIQEVDFDIEELEMKLDLSFRTRRFPDAADADKEPEAIEAKPPQDLNVLVKELASRKEGLSPCLQRQPKDLFNEFSHLFFSIIADQAHNSAVLDQFDQSSKLKRSSALNDCTYFGFFVRVWCGPHPALARVAALNMVKNRLKEEQGSSKKDVQALLPYCLSALGDASKRVRQAAADLVAVIAGLYVLPASNKTSPPLWGKATLYGKGTDFTTMGADVVARVLHFQVLPSVEECIMDPGHIAEVLRAGIDKGTYQTKPDPALEPKDHLSSSARQALFSVFSSHVVATPLLLVKARILKALNGVRSVSGTTRTYHLLPVLQWWASLDDEEVNNLCAAEKLEVAAMDSLFADIVVANDSPGLEFILNYLRTATGAQRQGLIQALFTRIGTMWSALNDNVKATVAEQLLEMSQQTPEADGVDTIIPAESGDLLKKVPLTTAILASFLDSIQTGTKMITEPPPNKRRRTSSATGTRAIVSQITPELSQTLRKVTFILQLVDNSDPVNHPELLDGLFSALSELQHFRTVVGSELGYLQNLILRSLLAMMPAYQKNKKLEIHTSGGYGDLLVNCIQKSSSPVVQNAALLLIASLASTAPSLVLHSVMPIFTFMGTSVLRQSDDYAAHVVSQTIKEVVPPLIQSLRKGDKGPVAGASDILVSFSTAYEHVPAHRRRDLFVALVETLGPREFLFALVSMLVDRYGPSEALLAFIVDLLNSFRVEVQLETLIQLLDLTADLYKPKPGLSFTLLGLADDGSKKDVEQVALRQLSAFPSFLSSKKLKAEIEKLADQDDMEASEVRGQYAMLLERILMLADTVKDNKILHSRCGAALANLLDLLSIGEFVRAVEDLLDRPDLGLRQKVLRALEVRVEKESSYDAKSRNVLVAFLPQLTAAIRESTDIRYKHTAVTCVDKIAEKYGKKDVEAVVAAATIIAGEHCLGQDERRLRVMAVLCLTSLVDVLQDAIVPVLPIALPTAIAYLSESIESETQDVELHAAVYSFFTALAEHLPYMLSNHLQRILEVSNKSAVADLGDEVNESRTTCLEFLARRMEAKEIFGSLEKNWSSATAAGFLVSFSNLSWVERSANFVQAVIEYLNVLGMAIEKHPKSTISKNTSTLTAIITNAFDLRRQSSGAIGHDQKQLAAIESSVNDQALKMIYKLNDAAFRPIFVQFVEWSSSGLSKKDTTGRKLRLESLYGFFDTFFGTLKSIVTNYATYILDDAVKVLGSLKPSSAEDRQLWNRVLSTLSKCFEHDQDDFWQSPSHFGAVLPVLTAQFLHAPSVDLTTDLIPTVVELAAAADSQAHQKELNSALLKHLKSEQTAVRLAAVKCEQELTTRLGEEWLSMLHEMLPRISELQEDDDEVVERETHRWIVQIEEVLGESLDAMLQ
jgi:U3 small nucleolar RNA-associated protein 10